jgi:hypothetical protein
MKRYLRQAEKHAKLADSGRRGETDAALAQAYATMALAAAIALTGMPPRRDPRVGWAPPDEQFRDGKVDVKTGRLRK